TIQPIQGRQNFVSAGSSRPYTSGQGVAQGKKGLSLVITAKAKVTCPSTKIALMANLSHYGSDNLAENSTSPALQDDLILSVIEQLKTQVVTCTKINQDNKQVNDLLTAELERYKHQERVLNELKHDEKASTSYEHSQEIDSLKHTLSEYLKEKESFKKKISILKDDLQKEESRNIDRELALEKEVKELNNIVFKRNQSAQTVHMLTKPQVFYNHATRQALGFQNPRYLKKAQQLKPNLYDGSIIGKSDVIVVPDSENTLLHAEEIKVPKELPKVSMVNSCLKKLKYHLASFDVVVKERTTATAITEGTWGFEHTKACFRDDIIPFVKNLKDNKTVAAKTEFQSKMETVLKENDRLLKHALGVDIVIIVVNDCMNVNCLTVDACKQCVTTESELKTDFIKKENYEMLLKQYNTLEKHCISLELNNQLNTEIFQRDNVSSSENAPNFAELFKTNELKARIQEKDTVIVKLKEKIKSLRADDKEGKVEDIETQNLELDHRVTKLTAKNNHLKQTYKQLFTQLSLRVFNQKNSVMT
nr:hypothetical protein [Tanacetum cinerariifolium]